MHSAQSTQSAKISMLMKGLDGGSVFMRHALKKPQKSPNSSQVYGVDEYHQMGRVSNPMLFNNLQLGSDSGSVRSKDVKGNSSDHDKSQNSNTGRNTTKSHNGQIFMGNTMMMGFGMYAAAGIQMQKNIQQQQPPHSENEQ